MGSLPQLTSSTNRFKNTPLHAGKSTNQTRVLRTKITLYFYKIPFVTQCLPMVFITILKFSKYRICYPNSCHDHNAKYTHLCHFPTTIPYFSGLYTSFMLHFQCNSLHVSCQHFQMSKLVYHVSNSCNFPKMCQMSKMSYTWNSFHFLLIIMLLCFQYPIQS